MPTLRPGLQGAEISYRRTQGCGNQHRRENHRITRAGKTLVRPTGPTPIPTMPTDQVTQCHEKLYEDGGDQTKLIPTAN